MASSIVKQARSLLPILLGTCIYAFGLHYFVLPNQLMEGGVTGITILLHYAFGWPLSITTLLLNIPLFVVGWKMLGRQDMAYTLVGTISLSFFLWIMERMIGKGWITTFHTTQDYILASLYAGVSLGSGLGIVFRFGGTTGGVDIIARIVSRWKGISMGQFILAMDGIIIGLALFFIPIEKVLYTLVTVFIASKLIDFIQEGAYSAKAFTVITNAGREIAAKVTEDMERGVTLLPAKGAFSGNEKEIVYCVIQRQEIRRMKSIIRSIDPRAFIVISEVHDVLGEGFSET
ncbi:YitT family protein [Paenibacillus protaetiae]|uniref:YitT family protein n=1 Tax=Paenibacillus protaetiae TaxID=2509456 RepID=A0A4P6EWM8_9BACL|nr:YitT family protein [Paenibacillus protaetiae]QAY66139.1 YitT family protein [Paenibacillus protaetiae]